MYVMTMIVIIKMLGQDISVPMRHHSSVIDLLIRFKIPVPDFYDQIVMGIPFDVALKAWIPFPVVGIVGIILSSIYIVYFQRNCRFVGTLICVLSVVFSLLVVIFIPVDVFLVSSTKTNGSKMAWADNNTEIEMKHIVLRGYYVIYGIVLLFVFILLPFTYFYHSFDDEQDPTSRRQKGLLRATKFTFLSFLLLAIILVVGVVVPSSKLPLSSSTIYRQMNYLREDDCFCNYLENGLVFAINCLGIIGMICSIIYTACGMSILPINLIKGKPKDDTQQIHMEWSVNELLEKIQNLNRHKDSRITKHLPKKEDTSTGLKVAVTYPSPWMNADEQPLGPAERKQLDRYSRQLSELQSSSDTMRQKSFSPLRNCKFITRPIQVILGLLLLLLSLAIVTALVLSSVNRIYSSYGIYAGYMANQSVVINPVDWLLLHSHKFFPLDYVLLTILLFYFTLSSVSGMQHIGIWFLWIQLHRLRRGRTTVQALVFSSFVLAVVTVYSGVFIYTIAPQYVTYGTQTYWNSSFTKQYSCSLVASPEECLMTQLMTFQTRLFYRMWFFGAIYFWCSWLFVLIFFISCIASIVRSRKTVAQIIVRNQREISESQERLIDD